MEAIKSNGVQPALRDGIVSREEWLVARKAHLRREKEITRMLDELRAERRRLPWVKLEKSYIFDGPEGRVSLGELFQGRSQLVLRHFMMGPSWEAGCIGCSFAADHVDSAFLHLEHHDVSFVSVSRAPIEKIEAFRKRMGWKFNWVSSLHNDFNFDFYVSFPKAESGSSGQYYNYEIQEIMDEELPGTSVFYRNEAGEIFHTYSTYGRGEELLVGAYNYLDLTPKGRNETGPDGNLMDWVKHHDRYTDEPNRKHACCS
ncbi:MAG TPA: thioredoxin family protein [Puia sp.]|nr:thioredoxin family protein [Puia sp.]